MELETSGGESMEVRLRNLRHIATAENLLNLRYIAADQHLVPGECLLSLDFANHYNQRGDKVTILVLWRVWSEVAGGPFSAIKASHECKSQNDLKLDDVFKHHLCLGKRGLLHGFHKIYLCGDHGPRFSSKQAPSYKEWGIESIVYASPYHDFNRCDGSGAEVKRMLQGSPKADDYNLDLCNEEEILSGEPSQAGLKLLLRRFSPHGVDMTDLGSGTCSDLYLQYRAHQIREETDSTESSSFRRA